MVCLMHIKTMYINYASSLSRDLNALMPMISKFNGRLFPGPLLQRNDFLVQRPFQWLDRDRTRAEGERRAVY
jgi:hypothetical protein